MSVERALAATRIGVDLRLLNVAARSYEPEVMVCELTPWAWAGFMLALLTGLGLFITRASAYVENPAFLVKAVLLALAGLNVALTHRRGFKGSRATRSAGALSLLLWVAILFAGRWIGHLS